MIERIRGRRLQALRAAFRDHEPLCFECLNAGMLRGWDELDHIVPLYKGGDYSFENLQGLCQEHHITKTHADMGRATRGCDEQGNPLGHAPHWGETAGEGGAGRGLQSDGRNPRG